MIMGGHHGRNSNNYFSHFLQPCIKCWNHGLEEEDSEFHLCSYQSCRCFWCCEAEAVNHDLLCNEGAYSTQPLAENYLQSNDVIVTTYYCMCGERVTKCQCSTAKRSSKTQSFEPTELQRRKERNVKGRCVLVTSYYCRCGKKVSECKCSTEKTSVKTIDSESQCNVTEPVEQIDVDQVGLEPSGKSESQCHLIKPVEQSDVEQVAQELSSTNESQCHPAKCVVAQSLRGDCQPRNQLTELAVQTNVRQVTQSPSSLTVTELIRQTSEVQVAKPSSGFGESHSNATEPVQQKDVKQVAQSPIGDGEPLCQLSEIVVQTNVKQETQSSSRTESQFHLTEPVEQPSEEQTRELFSNEFQCHVPPKNTSIAPALKISVRKDLMGPTSLCSGKKRKLSSEDRKLEINDPCHAECKSHKSETNLGHLLDKMLMSIIEEELSRNVCKETEKFTLKSSTASNILSTSFLGDTMYLKQNATNSINATENSQLSSMLELRVPQCEWTQNEVNKCLVENNKIPAHLDCDGQLLPLDRVVHLFSLVANALSLQ